MAAPSVRLGFFKLNVADMEPALAFWRDAFGFSVTMSFDPPWDMSRMSDEARLALNMF